MNREILFKAKRKDWKELPKEQWWVEGYYVYCRKRHYILPVLNKAIGFDEREDEWIEIDPDTLCQYTGLTDKNSQKIWENDIVVLDGACGRFVCKWADYIAQFIFENNFSSSDFVCYRGAEIEVVGNVFDNEGLSEVE